MYPTQGSLIHSYQLKKKLQLSWLSLSSKTDWVNPHLPPREEWLQLQFVSLCSHCLQNSQYPRDYRSNLYPELGPGGLQHNKMCTKADKSARISLNACLLYFSLGRKGWGGGCCVDKDYWHIWGFNKVRLHRIALCNYRHIPQPKILLCEPPTLHTENSALSFHLQFLLQPFLPPFPQISFEAGGGGGGGNLEGGGRWRKGWGEESVPKRSLSLGRGWEWDKFSHYLGKADGGEIGTRRRRKQNKEHQRPLRAKHRLSAALTQAAQLSDDICQGDVGHAFQLASNARQRLTAQVPWLDVPRY